MKSLNLTLIASILCFAMSLGQGCKGGDSHTAGHESHEVDHGFIPQTEPLPASGEGMWPWDDLDEMDDRDLRARGLKMRLDEIWSPTDGGLASAVVGLHGCTASFISPEGLMITNHHCAYGAVQRNSTDEKNLLEEGFLAATPAEELDGHGIRAQVFIKQIDVTVDITGEMPEGLSDLERMKYIEGREKELVAKCEQKPNTRCEVSRVNDGLRFVLLENLELRDVRLVAAPPESVGSFGGEVDNWQWPRHSLDFTLLRAYVGKDGVPAEYDPDNVPYKPERWLEITHEGPTQGDLVMVLGTPYHTSRYLTSRAISQDQEWYYPLREEVFSQWIGVLEQTCRDMPDACLPVRTDIRSLNNGLTHARGMIDGLALNGLAQKREAEQEQWSKWIDADPERQAKWGTALADLDGFLVEHEPDRDRDFLIRYLLRSSRLLSQAREITKLAQEAGKPDAEREPGYQDRDREDIVSSTKKAQKSLHVEAERRVLNTFLNRFAALPAEQRLAAVDVALAGDWSPEAIALYVDSLLATTLLAGEAERLRLLETGLGELQASIDPMIVLALALSPELDAYLDRKKGYQGGLTRLRPPYLESLIEFKGTAFYPDANATPRISFATVAGYAPRDGVWHAPFTTLSGLAAKNTGDKPFDAPNEVLDAIAMGDPGIWESEPLGDVPACFLSNADTTGGNSGSPALNGEGKLIGLNFDRVYENISGDYGYNPPVSRNVMVDARAIMWYLDKVLHAKHIMDELMLATGHHASHAPHGGSH